MTGRAYIGEVLNQVWLELLDKQVNAQKEKILRGSRKPTKKVCDENESRRKNDAHIKMLFMEGSPL